MAKDLGFSEGKPVAAFTIYNCLLHWRFFEAEKTSIFDRLIQLIGSAIEVTCCLLKSFLVFVCWRLKYIRYRICLKT